MGDPPLYTAAIVTFRRPESLAFVLEALRRQSVSPTLTVVADNDPDRSAHRVVERARANWRGEIIYEPVGENLGPSGGWALAIDTAGQRRDVRGDWVLVVDDDDPLNAPDLVGRLLNVGARHRSQVAAVGLRGARWNRRRARLVRVDPPEGAVDQVDYLASGGATLYRWSAIDEVGFFNSELFFGFEDLDLGWRLTSAGWSLLVAPQPSVHSVADTANSRTPWREYYKSRALTWILRERAGRWAQSVSLIRSVLLGGLRLSVVDRRPSLACARVLGAWDGMGGRLGVRRYRPTTNPPKSRHGQSRAS